MNISDISTHKTRIRNARSGSRDIARALQTELGEAGTFKDPNLSDEGNAKRRIELAQSKREIGARAARQIRADLEETRTTLTAAAQRLVEVPADSAELIRAEQRWNQARARLEGGEALPSILRTADSVTARAIAEHAPSYLMARGTKMPIETTLDIALSGAPDTRFEEIRDEVRMQAVRRLAEVNTDSTDRVVLEAYADVDGAIAAAEPWLSAIETMSDGHGVNMLDVAMQDAAVTGSAQRPAESAAEGSVAA